MSRRRRLISATLMLAGVLLLADVLVTLVWQEPVTGLVAIVKRHDINRRYLSYSSMPLTNSEEVSLQRLTNAEERIAFLARQDAQRVPNGAAIGRLTIPKIGVAYEVVQGTSTGDLELGPGHYSSTAFPGLGETVAIAGHRTTYLAPFRNINELHRGDRIDLQMPYGTFHYVVESQRVVTPDAWWITRNRGYERLVLSACNPLYSASQRIAVFARLVSVMPSSPVLATSSIPS
jgi:sortase A